MEQQRLRAQIGFAAAVAASALLSGCASVDRFGGRVVEYNKQMQDTRQILILGNILRSGYGEPLQFSDVSTITGTSSVQGSLGTVLPFFGPAGTAGARMFQINPGLQVSGGPSVNVANLNTQEFFNGITTPLTMDQVAIYVSNGQSRLPILLLTVSGVDYDVDKTHYHFGSTPDDLNGFNKLQSVIIALDAAKLTFELKDSTTYVGPPLLADEVFGKAIEQALARAPSGAKLPTLKRYSVDHAKDKTDADSAAAYDALSDGEKKRLGTATEFYRLTTTEPKTSLCFVAPGKQAYGYAIETAGPFPIRSTGIGKVTEKGSAGEDKDVEVALPYGGSMICSSKDKTTKGGVKNLTFTFRSVRGMFALLGAMARIELESGKQAADFDAGTYRLFGVRRDALNVAEPTSVANVKITVDRPDDFSATTIQLLSEFVALNSSAKSFPTPTIVPFVTR